MAAIIWYALTVTILFLSGWYLGWRLIVPADFSTTWRLISWLGLILLLTLPFLSYYFSRLGLNKISYIFSWVGYIVLGLISFVVTFLLLRDIAYLLWTTASKIVLLSKSLFAGNNTGTSVIANPERRRFLINATNMGILVLSSSLTGYGIIQARRKPGINRFDIGIANLHPDLEGLRIVQISDIHAGLTIRRDWIATIVEEVNKLSADIIAFTGDLVDGTVERLEPDVALLKNLKSNLGNFFITGNHEYYSGALPWVKKARELGFYTLINEHRVIEKGSARLLIAGVTDYTAGHFIPLHKTDPQKALQTTFSVDAKIFLAHQPRSLYEAAQYGFDLMLAGHTHGGQFFPWNFIAALGQPFIKGLHKYDTSSGEGWVYVSKGTGYWGPPVRVNARSEISIFTLRKT